MTGVILQFFPERLDVNGDAQNALVLAQRARWAGMTVDVLPVTAGDRVPATRPAAIVIGSSVDAELAGLRADLAPYAVALGDWVADGVPMLAVGTGWELLGEQLDLGSGSLEGVGLLPGRSQRLPERATGDLVLDSSDGRLVGFENHARGFVLPEAAAPLGTVVRGIGNGVGVAEGYRRSVTVGTHLHGPVLAKNPALADSLLSSAFGDEYRAGSPESQRADSFAMSARALILARLQLAELP